MNSRKRIFLITGLALVALLACYVYWNGARGSAPGQVSGGKGAESPAPENLIITPQDGEEQGDTGSWVPGEPREPAEKIAPNLKTETEADGEPKDRAIVVNVILRSPADLAGFTDKIDNVGGRVVAGESDESVFLRVEVPVGSLDGLALLEQVLYMEKYEPPRLLNDRAANITGARPLHEPGFAVPEGLTGKGQLVAVADTGLDTGAPGSLHQDFQDRVKALVSLYNNVPPRDTSGHGTHVAGTIAGTGAASSGKYRGLAPGAGLYVQSIVDSRGEPATPVDLKKLFGPAYEAGARVHVNSWGGSSNSYLASSMQVDDFIRVRPDLLVLFGAGNSGPDRGTVGPEANSKNALVVGAVENPRPGFGRDADNPEQVANLSSRGPAGDGRIKPELVAPGTAVISTASSQAADDAYALDEFYTRKSGTSMATAVTAGAAALLREYLVGGEKVESPSAALLKAALVNGADRLEGDTLDGGFGRLNVAATVLALKEKTMQLEDSKSGVAQDGSRQYTCEVAGEGAPFKATLAWTDPAAQPGAKKALVNDLDLMVIGPGGQVYYGNDTGQRKKADRVNNMEQVYIPSPEPGKYIVKVVGHAVTKNVVTGFDETPVQDFAVVYGTPLVRGVAARANDQGKQVLLAEGGLLLVGGETDVTVAACGPGVTVQGNDTPGTGVIKTGADLYYTGNTRHPEKIYAAYYTETANGLKGTALENGGYLTDVNGSAGGGYNLAGGDPGALLLVNGKETDNPGDIVAGADVKVVLNPSGGTAWLAEAAFKTVEGYFDSVDKQRLLLQNSREPIPLDVGVAIQQNIKWLEQLPYWTPFSHTSPGSLADLSSGDRVKVTVSPETGRAAYIEYDRVMLAGVLAGYDPSGNQIELVGGGSFNLAPRAKIYRDDKETTIEKLKPGDHLQAALLSDASRIWSINAFSNFIFGQVTYFNDVSGSLLILNEKGQYAVYSLQKDARVYWQGRELGFTALRENDYVRLALDDNNNLWRVDVATSSGAMGTEDVLETFDSATGYLTTKGGGKYLVTSRTAVLKNGIPVLPGDLVRGDKIKLTAAVSTLNNEKILGFIRAETTGINGPGLELNVPDFVESPEVTVSGTAEEGARIRLYVNRGDPEELKLQNGEFEHVVPLDREGTSLITVVAVDPRTGGVTSRENGVYWAGERTGMADISGHWAGTEIRNLVARGIVMGYPDGLFRPENPVSRVDFVRMVMGALGWAPGREAAPSFNDLRLISRADRPYVALAYNRGLVQGYPGDNTFRPDREITRAEMAVLVYRAINTREVAGPVEPAGGFPEVSGSSVSDIPPWALEAVAYLNGAGIMKGRWEEGFAPLAQTSRAEAAVVLSNMIRYLEK